jgi:drug/metabolite transporter (DMT)-like permease
MFFFGALFALPLFVAQEGWRELPRVSPAGWGAILFVSFVCTAAAYLINTHALKRLSAARVAAVQNIEPLVAVAAAGLLLNEAVTLPMLVGGAAILAGVYFAERTAPLRLTSPQPRPAAPEAAGD